ncbi:MAG: CDP-diacylglycerol--glycerol-3-phosphate 3-phosphatidyltransferase [Alphaproteobacteria bacterium]|nr:CDP-diacylglycerol--glycerol-3-phosphate 3-phosphatidyltransferase [Alphaproteobacteria bacterium]MDX5369389.1 CDP-diacylglycerol--glycerol-3-phosphate 3-phosphatidyltransferase [Alphaproteobacteria bacterium]MDX5464070.1 CDP-diacylglycerol--glycerol-3-phosphate 3-phosphatidyltransferase [Alphaproteobacteria bacterium]
MPYSLPNLLTYGRILAVPAVAVLLYWGTGPARWAALALFVAACITDYFDGYLARAWNQTSAIGRMLDPIADKLLVGAVLILLVHDGTIAGADVFAAVLILSREILVSGLREYLAGTRVSVPVTWLAKWKTAVQMAALGLLVAGPEGDRLAPGLSNAGIAGLWVAAALTLYTGYDYLRSGLAHVFAQDEAARPQGTAGE